MTDMQSEPLPAPAVFLTPRRGGRKFAIEFMSLANQKCKPCEAGASPLSGTRADELLAGIPGWKIADGSIVREFTFKNYYETTAFVNAVVWIAHREDHHPDIRFGYKTCRITYSTHSIGGLSENDFICAAKINALLPPP